MCENLLYDLFDKKINLETLFKWFLHENLKNEKFVIDTFKCSQCEFISYFLNYIYEILKPLNKKEDVVPKASIIKKIESISKRSEIDIKSQLVLDKQNRCDSNSPKAVTCTPRLVKRNVDETYLSPISPLYNKQVLTSKNSYHSATSSKTSELCLGDFLVTNRSNTKKNKRNENVEIKNSSSKSYTRRINPTNLAHTKFNGVNREKNCNNFSFENQPNEVEGSLERQRNCLMEERNKLLAMTSFNNVAKLTIISKEVKVPQREEIVPSVELVTHRPVLNIVVAVYSFLIKKNYVFNVVSEVYFLISLLVERTFKESEELLCELGVGQLNSSYSNASLFGTIHNRVYFASSVIQEQVALLKVFDSSTLSLLVENKRLVEFTSNRFLTQLTEFYDEATTKATTRCKNSLQTHVQFISETDNKDNFPNVNSFQAFRKQRDLFYELLRIWEEKHLDNQWCYSLAMGGKIRSLLSISSDPTNLIHLARLFKAQLLVHTCGDAENSVDKSVLYSVPNVNSDKLLRLNSRISNKQNCQGINSPPNFEEYEEFYKDFLSVVQNHVFIRHVIDAFASEIASLSDIQVGIENSGDIDSFMNESLKLSYISRVNSLRVLAKFVGYIDAMAYKCDPSCLSALIVKEQINIRREFQPSLNLLKILADSIEHKYLILSLPWMVNYMGILDHVTLRLPYLEQVNQKLFEIYFSTTAGQFNTLLIKLTLGWLFDLPHFPKSSYYAWLSRRFTKKPANLAMPITARFDTSEIVDQNIIYSCCRYLDEIKSLLNTSSSSSVAVKHITPSTFIQSPTNTTNKRLQMQLEESFFNSQPVSVRRTVEFISERVASTCVKEICNEIVPKQRKLALEKLQKDLAAGPNPHTNILENLSAESKKYCTSCIASLNKQIEVNTGSIMKVRIRQAIDSLLAIDVLTQTKEVCFTIASRTCRERVAEWTKSNINEVIFEKDFSSELKNFVSYKPVGEKPTFALPTYGKLLEHDDEALNGFTIVDLIRKCNMDLLEEPQRMTAEVVIALLESVINSVRHRCDLNDCILLQIQKLVLDLAFLLVVESPSVVLNERIVDNLSLIWVETKSSEDLFSNIICSRNLLLLNRAKYADLSWKSLQCLIQALVTQSLLSLNSFESQIEAVKKNSCSEVSLIDQCVALMDNIKLNGKP